ncbi:MAG: hypothetical protein JSU58_10505 [Dehalococcoidales bacterium]|nr:MAG: hypothetical protein JSU58_10505 [Dehalococcoidales bacterium]
MTQWQYLVELITLNELMSSSYFNSKGSEGWELIAVHRAESSSSRAIVIFKRPAQD